MEVRLSNMTAAKSVSDAVRTSLGPKGMDKMVRLPISFCSFLTLQQTARAGEREGDDADAASFALFACFSLILLPCTERVFLLGRIVSLTLRSKRLKARLSSPMTELPSSSTWLSFTLPREWQVLMLPTYHHPCSHLCCELSSCMISNDAEKRKLILVPCYRLPCTAR